MPRGQHPNSLANLKKGKATQFGRTGDSAVKASEMAVRASAAKRGIAEEMRALLEEPNKYGSTRRKVLAAKLVMNMDKSPEWYKLGLRMLGELPPEQVDVRNSVLSADAKADLDRLLAETKDDAR